MLSVAIGFLLLNRKENWKAYPILLMMILLGGYMICLGRQKHHTTGVMLWTVGLLLMFYLNSNERIRRENLIRLCVCNFSLLFLVVHIFYGEISRPSYDVTGKQIAD